MEEYINKKEVLKLIRSWWKTTVYDLAGAICNGVVLPDNATNGDMIKAMFPYACFEEYEDECRHIVIMWADGKASIVRSDFEWDWWNAPYEKYKKEEK